MGNLPIVAAVRTLIQEAVASFRQGWADHKFTPHPSLHERFHKFLIGLLYVQFSEFVVYHDENFPDDLTAGEKERIAIALATTNEFMGRLVVFRYKDMTPK